MSIKYLLNNDYALGAGDREVEQREFLFHGVHILVGVKKKQNK